MVECFTIVWDSGIRSMAGGREAAGRGTINMFSGPMKCMNDS